MADERITGEELKKLLDEYKAQGLSDEEILGASYNIYKDGKIEKEDLRAICEVLGYEFTPEFEKGDIEGAEGGEKLTPDEIEDAKEIEPEEAEEEEEESESEDEDEEDEEEEEVEDVEEEEDEKGKARKLFGLD